MRQLICLMILLVCLPAKHKAAVKFTLEGHTGHIREFSFSPDGKLLLTVDREFARLWDVSTGKLKAQLEIGSSAEWVKVAWSPGGDRIVVHGSRLFNIGAGLTRIWTTAGELKATLKGHDAPLWTLEWSSDGRTILTSGRDGKAIVWDAETGGQKFTLVHEEPRLMESESFWAGAFNKKRGSYESDVWAGFYSGDTVIVTWGSDGYLKRWEPATGRLLSPFALTTDVNDQRRRYVSQTNIRDMTTPDRRLTIGRIDTKGYEVVDIATGEVKARRENDGFPSSLSPDGTMILTSRRIVRGVFKLDQYEHLLWDVTTGKLLATFDQITDADNDYWSPRGDRVVIGLRHRLMDAKTGRMIVKLPYSCNPEPYFTEGDCGAVIFNQDGSLFLKERKKMTLWRAADGRSLGPLDIARPPIAFSPTDPRILATNAKGGKTVLIWELNNN